MSEKPPRIRQSPLPPEYDPELEGNVDTKWVRGQLRRLDSVAGASEVQAKDDRGPEAILDSLKGKDKKLFDEFLTKYEAAGGRYASPEDVKTIRGAAAKVLGGNAYNFFKEVTADIPENLPQGSTDELRIFEENLRAQVGSWRKEKEEHIDPAERALQKESEDFVNRKAREEHPEAYEDEVSSQAEAPKPEKSAELPAPVTSRAPVLEQPQSVVDEGEEVTLDLRRPLTDAERARIAAIMGDTPLERREYLKNLVLKANERFDISGKFERSKEYIADRSMALQVKLAEYKPRVVAGIGAAISGIVGGMRRLFEKRSKQGEVRAEGEKPMVAEEGAKKEGRLRSAKDIAFEKVEKVDAKTAPESKEGERTLERGERLRAFLAKRSEELNSAAEKYGPKLHKAIEGYNKLNWKTKLAITGGLMLGAGLSVSAAPLASSAFGAALWGQRVVAGFGTFLNKRKAIDERIKKNSESLWANRSEFTKNTYALAATMAWTVGTSFAVHEGVEALKVVGQSDVFDQNLDKAKVLAQEGFEKAKEFSEKSVQAYEELRKFEWLHAMLGHAPAQESVEDMVSSAAPTGPALDSPGVAETPAAEAAPSEPVVGTSEPSGPENVTELDPTLFAEPKTPGQLRVLAESSLSKLTPNQQAVLDNHIASLNPRERSLFNGFLDDISKSKAESPEIGIRGELHSLNTHWDELHEQREGILKEVETAKAEGSTAAAQELANKAEHIKQQMDGIKRAYDTVGPESAYGRDPIDGHVMTEQEAKDLASLRNAMHDPRGTDAWPSIPQKEPSFFDKVLGWFTPTQEEAQPATPEHVVATDGGESTQPEIPVQEPDSPTETASSEPFGGLKGIPVEESGRPPISVDDGAEIPREPDAFEQYLKETGKLDEYRAFAAQHQRTLAPDLPQHPEPLAPTPDASESSNINAFGIEIPETIPHIYSGEAGSLFAFGGTPEDRANLIQKFLEANPDKVVLGTDDTGTYRIPWQLVEGRATPGVPLRTSGFLGFGSSFVEAPKPEEFRGIVDGKK